MQPLKIKLVQNDKLLIKWNDGAESEILLTKLRMHCPCATCLAELENQSKSYIPIYSAQQVTIKNINPVGSYAISLTWMDGHNTGIYEFSYLYKIFSKASSLETG